jgi:hypothetical protein
MLKDSIGFGACILSYYLPTLPTPTTNLIKQHSALSISSL